MPLSCPQCRQPNDDDDRFCVQCGARLRDQASSSAEVELVERPRAERARARTLRRSAVLAGLALIALVAALLVAHRTPRGPVMERVMRADGPATPPSVLVDKQPAQVAAPRATPPAATTERATPVAPVRRTPAGTADTVALPRRPARAKAPTPRSEPAAMHAAVAPQPKRARPVARTPKGNAVYLTDSSRVEAPLRPVNEAP